MLRWQGLIIQKLYRRCIRTTGFRVGIRERENSVLKNLNNDYYNPFFSHIYVEKQVQNHPRMQNILAKYPTARIIEIGHYKDVFCRSRQDSIRQHRSQKLILAAKDGNLVYQGSPVCQSFGNNRFYYTSCMMNCIYDCEYCYLKGMYPSANIVVFVNLEDYFESIQQMLKSGPLYLCVSYDTDLLALEQVTGYVDAWSRFAAGHANELKIEIRTKCTNKHFFESQEPLSNVIYAFTLSPQAVVERFEHHTPSLAERIDCAAKAVSAGFPVRLCFDPMIYIPGWQQQYEAMLHQVFQSVAAKQLTDVSVGSFRIPQDYLKKMRRQQPDSTAAWFPYEIEHGYYHYPKDLMEEMEQFLVKQLGENMPLEQIFLWGHKK